MAYVQEDKKVLHPLEGDVSLIESDFSYIPHEELKQRQVRADDCSNPSVSRSVAEDSHIDLLNHIQLALNPSA